MVVMLLIHTVTCDMCVQLCVTWLSLSASVCLIKFFSEVTNVYVCACVCVCVCVCVHVYVSVISI